jgi:hypothetical protein
VISVIPTLVADLDKFITVMRRQWYRENRLFGFEALEMRLGVVRARILGVETTVQMYLEGQIPDIAPLEEPMLYPDGKTDNEPQHEVNGYAIAIWNQIAPVSFLQD